MTVLLVASLEVGGEIDMVLVATHFFANSLNSFGTRSDFKDMILLLYQAWIE